MTPLASITREILEPIWMRRDIPTERIANALGVSRQAVSLKARALGLPSRAGNQECNKRGDDALFTRMWNFGVCSSDMADHFGYRYSASVSVRRRNMGMVARPNGFRFKRIGEFWEVELGQAMIENRST